MKRKVIRARLHDMKFVIAGIGQLDTDLPSQRKVLPGFSMSYDGSILELEIAGKTYGVPLANVIMFEFDEEPVKATPISKL